MSLWHKGGAALAELPHIRQGLKALTRNHPALARIHAQADLSSWKLQPDGFSGLVQIILAQQVSSGAATAMLARLTERLPEPHPEKFLKLPETDLKAIGLSRQKIAYCRNLAEEIYSGRLDLDRLNASTDDDAILQTLMALKGIGRWSAEIYLMFSLGRADIWPAGDLAIRQGLRHVLRLQDEPDEKKALALGEQFRPWRTAAALLVWSGRGQEKRAARAAKTSGGQRKKPAQKPAQKTAQTSDAKSRRKKPARA